MSKNAEPGSETAFTPHVVGLIAAAGKRIDLGRRRVTHYSRDERLIYELALALSDATARLDATETEPNGAKRA